MFFNNDTNGFIAVIREKTIFDLGILSLEKREEIWTKHFEERKKSLNNQPSEHYSHEFYNPSLFLYGRPVFSVEKFRNEDELFKRKGEQRSLIYIWDTFTYRSSLFSFSKIHDTAHIMTLIMDDSLEKLALETKTWILYFIYNIF